MSENINEINDIEIPKEKNIGKIISDATDRAIKSLSGQDLKISTRVIDNVVAFIGAAGGVGTSTLVANLAYTLTKKKMRVLVIDLNVMYPIQHCLFGIKQEIERKDLVSFLMGKNDLGESIININTNLAILYANNRYLMDHINCDNANTSNNLVETIDRIKHLFDMIIIDCPRQIEFDIINSLLYICDTIYSVWDENIACVANMERLRKNMLTCGVESYAKTKVIMNKKTDIHYTNYVFEQLKLDLVGVLPYDQAIVESGLNGHIFCEKGASMSKTAAEYVNKMDKLADKILEIGGYELNG